MAALVFLVHPACTNAPERAEESRDSGARAAGAASATAPPGSAAEESSHAVEVAGEGGESGDAEPGAGAPTFSGMRLEDCVLRVLSVHPALRGSTRELRRRQALELQAGLLPNPSIEVEAENLLGSGEFHSLEELELTVGVKQRLEIGGKRKARQAVAARDVELAAEESRLVREEIVSETAGAFVRLLAAQERLDVSREILDAVREAREAADLRLEAGEISAQEASRATVAETEMLAEVTRRESELASARAVLASQWGSARADFERALGTLSFQEAPEERSLDELLGRLDSSPALRRQDALVARGETRLTHEKSNAVPDLDVSAGYRRLAGPEENAFVAAVAVPLPLFSRNQGGVAAAGHELEAIRAMRLAARQRLAAQVVDTYYRLGAARDEARRLEEEIVPAAQRIHDEVLEQYRLGSVSYLNVLEARREAARVRLRLVDRLEEARLARWKIGRLLGDSEESLFGSSQDPPASTGATGGQRR